MLLMRCCAQQNRCASLRQMCVGVCVLVLPQPDWRTLPLTPPVPSLASLLHVMEQTRVFVAHIC